EKSRRWWWELVTIALPVLLTVGLGWWVTRAQTQITQTIDDQKQELTTKLAITQEYQKRKLDAYQECTRSVSNLTQALDALQMDPRDQTGATDAVRAVYGCTENNMLYVTQEVADALSKVQNDAIEVMQKTQNSKRATTAA